MQIEDPTPPETLKCSVHTFIRPLDHFPSNFEKQAKSNAKGSISPMLNERMLLSSLLGEWMLTPCTSIATQQAPQQLYIGQIPTSLSVTTSSAFHLMFSSTGCVISRQTTGRSWGDSDVRNGPILVDRGQISSSWMGACCVILQATGPRYGLSELDLEVANNTVFRWWFPL